MKADLHFHSSYSDGELKVSELIEIVKEKNIDFACLTDHDSIMGSEEFIKLSKENGIISYPALELSTYNNDESIHVLAYFKSIDSIGDELKEHLIYMKKRRYERMKEFVSNINNLYGFNIDFDEIVNLHPHMLERPHLAEAISKITGETYKVIFEKYIGDKCPGFIPSSKLPTKEGIELIHRSGGLAILAHPYQYTKNDPYELINMGVDGVEVFYFPTPQKKYKKYKKYCNKHNLLMTGGSDFHRLYDFKHSSIGSVEFGTPYTEELINRIEEL